MALQQNDKVLVRDVGGRPTAIKVPEVAPGDKVLVYLINGRYTAVKLEEVSTSTQVLVEPINGRYVAVPVVGGGSGPTPQADLWYRTGHNNNLDYTSTTEYDPEADGFAEFIAYGSDDVINAKNYGECCFLYHIVFDEDGVMYILYDGKVQQHIMLPASPWREVWENTNLTGQGCDFTYFNGVLYGYYKDPDAGDHGGLWARAINCEDGSIIWSTELTTVGFNDTRPAGQWCCAPLITDSGVLFTYLQADHNMDMSNVMSALLTYSGVVTWKNQTISGLGAIHGNCAAKLDGETFLVPSGTGVAVRHAVSDGSYIGITSWTDIDPLVSTIHSPSGNPSGVNGSTGMTITHIDGSSVPETGTWLAGPLVIHPDGCLVYISIRESDHAIYVRKGI